MKYVVLLVVVALPALGALSTLGDSASRVLVDRTNASATPASRSSTPELNSAQSAAVISNAARGALHAVASLGEGVRQVPDYFRTRLHPGMATPRAERAEVWATHKLLGGREYDTIGAGRITASAHRTGYLDGDGVEHALAGHRKTAEAWHDPEMSGQRFVGEIDVHETADNPPDGIVTHDADTLRATGVPGAVDSRGVEELQRLSLLDRQGNKTDFGMASLDEVMELPLHPRSEEAKSPGAARVLVSKLLRLTDEEQQAYLTHSAFYGQDPESIRLFRDELGANAVVGLDKADTSQWIWRTLPFIRHFNIGPGPKLPADATWISRAAYAVKTHGNPVSRWLFKDRMPNAFDADVIAPPMNLAQLGAFHKLSEKNSLAGAVLRRVPLTTKRLVKAANEHGLQVVTWTLNTEGEIRKALKLGVDFYTDTPSLTLRVVQQMKAQGHVFN